MTSATEVLCRLLDECGMDYRVSATGYSIDIGPYITAYANRSDTTLDVSLRQVTPEQAIAATLGSCSCSNSCTNGERTGTCHEIEDEDTGFIVCSECGAVHDESYTAYYCWCCGRRIEQ